jgi:hypothetical protein
LFFYLRGCAQRNENDEIEMETHLIKRTFH